MIITTNSSEETILLGARFAKLIKGADVILLEGDLGGGKTTFVRGVLGGFGYKHRALSPSFTLVRRYKVKGLILYHIDLYRLSKGDDMFDLGIEDYIYKPGNCFLIEWGEKIETSLSRYLKLKFSFVKETSRKIAVSSKGYNRDKLKPLKEKYEFVRN
ncbi:MAG: tRNA (adenosine(37)-N6)-threonylcarbamoyltransferase complex ATPase subunit type 1 TsaE [Candidatus Omnitrophota bacterium]|nr:MAG: tRNA (adenosine(37)-N6)-threonylcarbamoyltransferase complex ATPase subunit type 1 TsaE [Candidatus Omnitrophota bacterium]